MNCIKLNIRSVILIVLAVILNGVKHSHMAVNHMDAPTKDQTQKQIVNLTDAYIIYTNPNVKTMDERTCPIELHQCNKLSPPCIKCDFNYTCVYGETVNTTCSVGHLVECIGDKKFQRTHICQYCYQTQHWEHTCAQKANCNSVSTPGQYYRTNCSVNEDVLCLGKRNFLKNLRCNWTGGYRWSTALFLSITLGGFGADRFYLGHWQEGIGKLFSFGGLGVWTLIDVILISLHYLGPADGSLFI